MTEKKLLKAGMFHWSDSDSVERLNHSTTRDGFFLYFSFLNLNYEKNNYFIIDASF